MTFSILAKDPTSDAIGGAAATGSLCVGGWVLRGSAGTGMSASQGRSPSTLWGEDAVALMRSGATAASALRSVVEPDAGRAQRQLSVLEHSGEGAAFSGDLNTPEIADRVFEGGVAAGNMLAGAHVVDAMVETFLGNGGSFSERLLAALKSAEQAGGDIRGLQSAALLVVSPERAPLSLRVDFGEDPIAALETLHGRATTGDYARWAEQVPTLSDPGRVCD